MTFLTDFADQAVMLPLAALVAVMLAVLGWWRGALAWVVAVGGVLATMGVLKIVFLACAGPLAVWGIRSPSGHTAAATVVYGGMLLLLGRGSVPASVLAAGTVLIAALFGASRLALHAHNLAEVALGAAVGLAGAALLLWLAGKRPALRGWVLAAAALLVMLGFHGMRMPAERMIHAFALQGWLPAVCRA